MAPQPSSSSAGDSPLARLDTTSWSLVLDAGHRSSPASAAALEALCQTYWYPLYAYVRRRVNNAEEAQDLTQEFFAVLLEKGYLLDVRPERGRFRAFLITAFKHFLSKQWDQQRAVKRGGGRERLALDFADGEKRFQLEPVDDLTPERLYERQWVITLTGRVLQMLQEECEKSGKGVQFALLKSFLAGVPPGQNYTTAAATLHLSEGAVRVAVHRLRGRYADLLRAAIRETVVRPDEVNDEIQAMFAAFQ